MISVPLRTKLEQIFEIFIKKFGHFFLNFKFGLSLEQQQQISLGR